MSGDIADSVNAKLAEARSLQETDPKGAIDRYDAVLKVDPDNAEALTYRGWLVARVGAQAGAADLVDSGEQALDRAIQVSPTYADPYCFKAIIEFRYRGDAAGGQGAGRHVPRRQPAAGRAGPWSRGSGRDRRRAWPRTGTTVAPSTTLGG